MSKTFEIGKTYFARRFRNMNDVIHYTVLSRTDKTVTVKTQWHEEPRRCKLIETTNGCEAIIGFYGWRRMSALVLASNDTEESIKEEQIHGFPGAMLANRMSSLDAMAETICNKDKGNGKMLVKAMMEARNDIQKELRNLARRSQTVMR